MKISFLMRFRKPPTKLVIKLTSACRLVWFMAFVKVLRNFRGLSLLIFDSSLNYLEENSIEFPWLNDSVLHNFGNLKTRHDCDSIKPSFVQNIFCQIIKWQMQNKQGILNCCFRILSSRWRKLHRSASTQHNIDVQNYSTSYGKSFGADVQKICSGSFRRETSGKFKITEKAKTFHFIGFWGVYRFLWKKIKLFIHIKENPKIWRKNNE